MPVVWPFDGGGSSSLKSRMALCGNATRVPAWRPVNKGGSPALARHALAVSSSKAKNPRGFGGQRPPSVATGSFQFTQNSQCLLLLTTNPKFVSF